MTTISGHVKEIILHKLKNSMLLKDLVVLLEDLVVLQKEGVVVPLDQKVLKVGKLANIEGVVLVYPSLNPQHQHMLVFLNIYDSSISLIIVLLLINIL
jgi:hypothetical protein